MALYIGNLTSYGSLCHFLFLNPLSLCKLHIYGTFLPQHVDFTFYIPSNALFCQVYIKIPNDFCKNQSHLCVRKASV